MDKNPVAYAAIMFVSVVLIIIGALYLVERGVWHENQACVAKFDIDTCERIEKLGK